MTIEEKQRQARSPNSWPFQGWGGEDDPGRFSGHQTGTGLQSQLYKVLPEVLPQPHWPPPASSNKEKSEEPLAAGRSLAAQVALTASAIPNLDGGEISREGSPQPEAFVSLLWLGWPGSTAFSPPLQPGSHRPLFYLLHTPAGRAHPFPGSSSPGWQALEGLETPQVQGKRDFISLAPLLVLDRHGLHTHTNTPISLPLDPTLDL